MAAPVTLWVFSLLVLTAALAGYWLSRSDVLRGFAWMGIGVGTLFLLAAATIAILATGFIVLHRVKDAEAPRLAVGPLGARGAASHAEREESEPADGSHHRDIADLEREQSALPERSSVVSADSGANTGKMMQSPSLTSAARNRISLIAAPDLWSATACVVAFQIDPLDPERWIFENDCDGSVAVLIAVCTQSKEECVMGGPTLWRNRPRPMILPLKALRSVTDAEQTQRGKWIRYAACLIGDPVSRLVGMDQDTRASATWQEQFSEATTTDSCLAATSYSLSSDTLPDSRMPSG